LVTINFLYTTAYRLSIVTFALGSFKKMSRSKVREGIRWGVTKCDRGGEGFLQRVMSRWWNFFVTFLTLLS